MRCKICGKPGQEYCSKECAEADPCLENRSPKTQWVKSLPTIYVWPKRICDESDN